MSEDLKTENEKDSSTSTEISEELKSKIKEEIKQELKIEMKNSIVAYDFIKSKQFKIGVILFLCLILIGEIGTIAACLSVTHRNNYINYDRDYYLEYRTNYDDAYFRNHYIDPAECKHYKIVPLQNSSNTKVSTPQPLSAGTISR